MLAANTPSNISKVSDAPLGFLVRGDQQGVAIIAEIHQSGRLTPLSVSVDDSADLLKHVLHSFASDHFSNHCSFFGQSCIFYLCRVEECDVENNPSTWTGVHFVSHDCFED